MSAHVTVHGVITIRASTPGSLGAPIILSLVSADSVPSNSITIFLDDHDLAMRIASAINDAVEYKCEPDQAHQEAHDAVHTAYAYKGSCR